MHTNAFLIVTGERKLQCHGQWLSDLKGCAMNGAGVGSRSASQGLGIPVGFPGGALSAVGVRKAQP